MNLPEVCNALIDPHLRPRSRYWDILVEPTEHRPRCVKHPDTCRSITVKILSYERSMLPMKQMLANHFQDPWERLPPEDGPLGCMVYQQLVDMWEWLALHDLSRGRGPRGWTRLPRDQPPFIDLCSCGVGLTRYAIVIRGDEAAARSVHGGYQGRLCETRPWATMRMKLVS